MAVKKKPMKRPEALPENERVPLHVLNAKARDNWASDRKRHSRKKRQVVPETLDDKILVQKGRKKQKPLRPVRKTKTAK